MTVSPERRVEVLTNRTLIHMHQNLGRLDRILRFALAFWWLGPWAPLYLSDWANVATSIVGWIALLESFAGWCLLHTLLRIDNRNQ